MVYAWSIRTSGSPSLAGECVRSQMRQSLDRLSSFYSSTHARINTLPAFRVGPTDVSDFLFIYLLVDDHKADVLFCHRRLGYGKTNTTRSEESNPRALFHAVVNPPPSWIIRASIYSIFHHKDSLLISALVLEHHGPKMFNTSNLLPELLYI